MKKEKLLLILHHSPPIHGASKVGDTILQSKIVKSNFNAKFIQIKSSENLESIGKFKFKKILNLVALFSKVIYNLFFFRPKKIYYTASPNGFAFYRDLLIFLPIKIYVKLNKCEIFFHYHALGINDFIKSSSIKKMLTNFFIKNVNLILISEKVKNEIKNLKSYKNVFFLENGVEDNLLENEFEEILKQRKATKSLNILFLSNLIKSKGYDTVLKLAKDLKLKGFKNIQFHFAGKWASNSDKLYFNNYVFTNNLEEFVNYHGLVSGKIKKDLFTSANMFIFPTRYSKEVFPLSLLEALSYGLPVLAFNKGAVSSIIDKKVGIISNEKMLLSDFIKMEKMYLNNDVYLAARDRFLQNYSIKIFEQNLCAILK